MRVQRLASSLLEHVGPHLLDGPAQLFTEQENPEIDQLRDDEVSNLPKQLVVARIGDLGMEELIRAQIALDPRAADRRHRRRVEIRTEQPRRTQQRDREKRLDLIHVSRSTVTGKCEQCPREGHTATAVKQSGDSDRFCQTLSMASARRWPPPQRLFVGFQDFQPLAGLQHMAPLLYFVRLARSQFHSIVYLAFAGFY